MRLIDADALRESMYHDTFETDSDMQKWDGGCWIRYKLFENNIDKAPTIKIEQNTGRWIPCSDRLPEVKPEGEIEVMGRRQLEMMDSTFEISEPVEVTCETDVGYKVTVAQWEVDGERRRYWVNDDGGFVDGVIAWRPMPEPYKEVEHDG